MRSVLLLLCFCAVTLLPGLGTAQNFRDTLVQTPEALPSGPASISGAFAKTAFGADTMGRGVVSLPSPFEYPTSRGSAGIDIRPGYSSEDGLSEWGMGFALHLGVRRFREVGLPSFDERDDFSTPFGRITQGDDGDYYVVGLRARTRFEYKDRVFMAVDPEGTRFTFSADAGIEGPAGVLQWNLVEIETLHGETTAFSWRHNRSGRPFLDAIEYGGTRDAARQVRIEIAYEPVDEVLFDFSSGQPLRLDERVKKVTVSVRPGGNGAFSPRYSYTLSHTQSPSGPAFYLTEVVRAFASGAQDPAFRFEYDHGFDNVDALEAEATNAFDGILRRFGAVALKPEHTARLDVDADGVTELEHHASQELIQWDGNEFTVSSPDTDGLEDPYCRPSRSASNPSRVFATLRPSDASPTVLHLLPSGGETEIRVCDRQGRLLGKAAVYGEWRLDSSTSTMADVNRDGRPDLVQMQGNTVQVLLNESTEARYGFVAQRPILLRASITPRALFAHDVNGDALVDLIVRHDGGLAVFYGTGNLEFYEHPRPYLFYTVEGKLMSPRGFGISFFDGNRDGLMDVALSHESRVLLFANVGTAFVQLPARHLAYLGGVGYPVLGDLLGSGELELYFVTNAEARRATLTQPSNGLMLRADDGRGTTLHFTYDRTPRVAGARQRRVVLSELRHQSGGLDDESHVYAYEEPQFHPETSALIGFKKVHQTAPLLHREVVLHQAPHASGLFISSRETDLRSDFQRVERRTLVPRDFEGIPYMREEGDEVGFATKDGSIQLTHRRAHTDFARELCPVTTVETFGEDTLTQERRLASPKGLEGSLHCLTAEERSRGAHKDASLDFARALHVVRNDAGQPVEIWASSSTSGDRLTLQTVTYDAQGRPRTLSVPNRGTTSITYAPHTGLITEVEDATGMRLLASFDPMTDAMLKRSQDRGATPSTTWFAYDAHERLNKTWSNGTGTTEASPLTEHLYTLATHSAPSVRRDRTRVTQRSVRELWTFNTARGDRITTADIASLKGRGKSLIFGPSTRLQRETGHTEAMRLEPIALGDEKTPALSYAHLYDGSWPVATAQRSGFGATMAETQTVQEGVLRARQTRHRLTSEALIVTIEENGERAEAQYLDGAGRVTRHVNAQGGTTHYAYDVLGRLTGVTLENGDSHRVRYDDLGRLSEVDRSGVQRITHHYLQGTTLAEEERVYTAAGELMRRTLFTYDERGRVLERNHIDARSGEAQRIAFEYDGFVDGERVHANQVGHLTHVSGDAFKKTFVYDLNDRPSQERVSLVGFREVERQRQFFMHGELKSERTLVRDEEGAMRHELLREWTVDNDGRPSGLAINGTPIVSQDFDRDGNVDEVRTPESVLHLFYDTATKGLRATTHVEGDWVTDLDIRYNDRGFIAAEALTLDASPTTTRTYDYDDRGFVIAADSEWGSESFGYDPIGRRESVADERGFSALIRVGNELNTGRARYQYDELGRVVAHTGDGRHSAYDYDGRGNLRHANVDGAELAYVYDESDQRLMKSRNGRPEVAFVGDAFLTESEMAIPVKAAGRLVGLVVNGVFDPLATDTRGTVLRDGEDANVADTFGTRRRSPAFRHVVDFAEKGFDADLGTVRMGVRDYDPALGEFRTPDPLFLAQPDLCVASPIECNLYSYAKNNPLTFVDPTGRISEEDGAEAAEAMSGTATEAASAFGKFADEQLSKIDWQASAGASFTIDSSLKVGSKKFGASLTITSKLAVGPSGEPMVKISVSGSVSGQVPLPPQFAGADAKISMSASVQLSAKLGGTPELKDLSMALKGGLIWEAKTPGDWAGTSAKASAEIGLSGKVSTKGTMDASAYLDAKAAVNGGGVSIHHSFSASFPLYSSGTR